MTLLGTHKHTCMHIQTMQFFTIHPSPLPPPTHTHTHADSCVNHAFSLHVPLLKPLLTRQQDLYEQGLYALTRPLPPQRCCP